MLITREWDRNDKEPLMIYYVVVLTQATANVYLKIEYMSKTHA